MSVDAECKPKTSIFGFTLNAKSYTNRGIFKNPLHIIDGEYKGLAMLLHGFSTTVIQMIFPEKECMEVSPIASMQYILYHTLPREAFRNSNADYEAIQRAAANMSGGESVTNFIEIPALSEFYFNQSAHNKLLLDDETSQQSTQFKI